MARQPAVELDAQLGLQRLRIDARPHSAQQVEIVFVGSLGPRHIGGKCQLGRDGQPDIRHAPASELGAIEPRRSHPDDGKRMPVDLEIPADYRRVRAVLAFPDAVAHHRDQRRACLVVGVGHQPAHQRLHAQGAEKVPRHILPVARIHRRLRSCAPHAKRRIAGLQGGKIGELRRMFAEILVRLPGEERKVAIAALHVSAPVAAADLVPDPPQLLRLRHRQRLQHHLVHQRKDGRCRSDSQSQSNDNRRRKSGCLPQLP